MAVADVVVAVRDAVDDEAGDDEDDGVAINLRDAKSRSTEPRMMSAQHEACTAHAFPKSFAE